MIIGGVLAWTSPSIDFLKNPTIYSAPFKVISENEENMIGAFTPLGAIIGAIPAGIIADMFGRKLVLIIFTVPWIGTWILTTFASSISMLYAARFVSGIIVGMFCAVLPMYVNEIAEDSIRGKFYDSISYQKFRYKYMSNYDYEVKKKTLNYTRNCQTATNISKLITSIHTACRYIKTWICPMEQIISLVAVVSMTTRSLCDYYDNR